MSAGHVRREGTRQTLNATRAAVVLQHRSTSREAPVVQCQRRAERHGRRKREEWRLVAPSPDDSRGSTASTMMLRARVRLILLERNTTTTASHMRLVQRLLIEIRFYVMVGVGRLISRRKCHGC
jgi:hypothetical protein